MIHSETLPEYYAAEDGSWFEVGSPQKLWSYQELIEAIDQWKVRWQIAQNEIARQEELCQLKRGHY